MCYDAMRLRLTFSSSTTADIAADVDVSGGGGAVVPWCVHPRTRFAVYSLATNHNWKSSYDEWRSSYKFYMLKW